MRQQGSESVRKAAQSALEMAKKQNEGAGICTIKVSRIWMLTGVADQLGDVTGQIEGWRQSRVEPEFN